MSDAAKILAYTLAVFVLGCMLAPPLYWGGRALVDAGLLPFLNSFGFARYFNRAVLVAAVALLWPTLRWLSIGGMAELGLSKNPARSRHLAVGFAVGLVGLSCVATVMLLVGRAALRPSFSWLTWAGIVIGAAAVAVVEETFFRGALFGVLRRQLSPWRALTFLSVFFACLHFLKPPPRAPKLGEIGWDAGFRVFTMLFWQFREPRLIVGGLLTLFLVGMVLGYTVLKTRSLFMAMGLHAGWVLALRTFDLLTRRHGNPSVWLGKDLITGLAPVVLIATTWALLAVWLSRRPQPDPALAATTEVSR